jgi:hypothetical protein
MGILPMSTGEKVGFSESLNLVNTDTGGTSVPRSDSLGIFFRFDGDGAETR